VVLRPRRVAMAPVLGGPPHLRTMEAIRERFEIMRDDPFTEVWRIAADGRPIGQIELVGIHASARRTSGAAAMEHGPSILCCSTPSRTSHCGGSSRWPTLTTRG
jgi:hypothetical protein